MGGEKEKEMLVFVCIFLVCGGDFSVSLKLKNSCASSFYRCFTILCSHNCGITYTRFHTFTWWRKTGMLKFFIIPVVRDIGADYTSQSRSEFDWYNPDLYYYFHDIVILDNKFENGRGFMQFNIRLLQSKSYRMEVLQNFKQILNSYTFSISR